MLEKLKTIPFVEESSAVKVVSTNGAIELERYDRVVWAKEKTPLTTEQEILCYVEADKLLSLLPCIASMEQTPNHLLVTLNNGAKYELPFLTVSWETRETPTEWTDTINCQLDDLMSCTLQNLIKPELQCIRVDEKGAVSCDFVSACISTKVKSTTPFLMPPDIQALVNGRLCKFRIDATTVHAHTDDFDIEASLPQHSDEDWWEQLRQMVAETTHETPVGTLPDSIKRLALFSDYVSFEDDKVVAGSNFEPFNFVAMGNLKFEVEKLTKILTMSEKMAIADSNLVLSGAASTFLFSPVEETE